MSYKQIDEPLIMLSNKQVLQLAKKFVDEDDADGFCKSFVFATPQIIEMMIDQAKAEQREEDAKVAEGKKTHNDYSTSCVCDQCGSEREEITHNSTCDSIATAIRQEGE